MIRNAFLTMLAATAISATATAPIRADDGPQVDAYVQSYVKTTDRHYAVLKGLLDRNPSEETRKYLQYAMYMTYVRPGDISDVSFDQWRKQVADGRAVIEAARRQR